MQHLAPESLARLVDEAAAPEEHTHLEACAACRAELAAMREQTAALAELPMLSAPAGVWDSVQARLHEERLMSRSAPAARRPATAPWMLRAAVYAGLFLLGAATTAAFGAARAGAADREPAVAVATVEDAELHLRAAEDAYLAALASYQQLSGSVGEAHPAARLAALEGIVLSTRAALEEAPADPVINGYYLTAVGQRDAVLRQIAAAGDPWF
jgi:hypothetical protein